MTYDPIMAAPTSSELQFAISILRRKAEADAQCARDCEAMGHQLTADAYLARELGLRCAAELVHDCIEGILHDV